MNATMEQYKLLVEFLGRVLGPGYEVVLQDLTLKEPSVAAIAGGEISGRTVGAPLTDAALGFLQEKVYERSDYQLGYRGISPHNDNIRSSTLFLKDGEGALVGMLCVNYDMQAGQAALKRLSELLRLAPEIPETEGEAPAFRGVETLSGSVGDTVAALIREALGEVAGSPSIPPKRLTQKEKVEVVGVLNRRGLFCLKGAVSEVAARLGSSEATIYRYLARLNQEKEARQKEAL